MNRINNLISRAVSALSRRVNLLISRAVLKAVDDSTRAQLTQLSIYRDEIHDRVQRMMEYGFTSVPLPGAEGVVVSIGGDRSHGILIATDDRRYRLKGLQGGEVALYTDEGDCIKLRRNRNIEILCGSKVTVDAPNAEFTGNVKITGNIEVVGESTLTGDVAAAANVSVGGNANIAGICSAAGFTGPAGGPMAVSVDISTSGDVSGGGTSMSDLKAAYNSHTHSAPGGGGTTTAPSPTV